MRRQYTTFVNTETQQAVGVLAKDDARGLEEALFSVKPVRARKF
jgi:hypothetical protein